MDQTALTVGGFTQPCVAKSLIELPASIEKGLTQRFLWIFPKPSFAKFDTLELIDETFSEYLGDVYRLCKTITCSIHGFLIFSDSQPHVHNINCSTYDHYNLCS